MLPLLTLHTLRRRSFTKATTADTSQLHRGHYPRSENAHQRTRADAQLRADLHGGGEGEGEGDEDEGGGETKTRGGGEEDEEGRGGREKARNPSEDPRARGRVVLQRAAPGRPQRPPGLKHR